MVAEHGKPLKDRLIEAMEIRKIKFPALAKAVDIPEGRMRAWYRDNTNPKIEDVAKIEKWLSEETSTYPVDLRSTKLAGDEGIYQQVILSLSDSSLRNSDANLINARNIDRLITIIEKTLGAPVKFSPEPDGGKIPDELSIESRYGVDLSKQQAGSQ